MQGQNRGLWIEPDSTVHSWIARHFSVATLASHELLSIIDEALSLLSEAAASAVDPTYGLFIVSSAMHHPSNLVWQAQLISATEIDHHASQSVVCHLSSATNVGRDDTSMSRPSIVPIQNPIYPLTSVTDESGRREYRLTVRPFRVANNV